MYQPKYSHCMYLSHALETDRLRDTIAEAVRRFTPLRDTFDAIAFRGMSGALVAPALAMALDKTLIMVRKPEESNHSGRRIEGDCGARRYIVVDDQISTGRTIGTIVATIEVWAPPAKLVGVALLSFGTTFITPEEFYRECPSAIDTARATLRGELAANPFLVRREVPVESYQY